MVNQDNFHAMLGHVSDGQQVKMNNGTIITIVASMRGWMIQCEGKNVAGPIGCGPAAALNPRAIARPATHTFRRKQI